jgi:arylsulfatase A-like enzyme
MPWYVPQKYFDMFPLEGVTTPELLKDDLDDVPPLGREITTGKSRFVDNVLKHGLHKQAVQAYLATTAYADAQMGRVLDALDNSPYRDNTIVILMSDHGFHLGEKHHWQKSTLWEEATHCLLMLRVPGTTPRGGRCERFVSLQDVYPTLTELCDIARPAIVEGRSLVPLLRNPHAGWKSTAITAYADRYVTIRNERFRYIRYRGEQEEFYDVARDPHEWKNEIRNPIYAAAIAELRKAVPALSEMAPAMPRKKKRQQ